MAGAQRCHRDVVDTARIDGHKVAVCKRHRVKPWDLFRGKDEWVYAVNLDSEATKTKGSKKRRK